METDQDKAGFQISSSSDAVLDWRRLLGVAECWKVLYKLLHFGGKRKKTEIRNAHLTGETCLGSVVLA